MANKKKSKKLWEAEKNRREAAKVVQMAKSVPNQDLLNSILLDVPNRIVRREVYELIRPHLKFEATYPDWVAEPHSRGQIDPVTN